MAASLLGLSLFLAGTSAFAQQQFPPSWNSRWNRGQQAPGAAPVGDTLIFSKSPTAPATPAPAGETLHFSKDTAAPVLLGVQPAAMQIKEPGAAAAPALGPGDNQEEYYIQLDPPGPQRLFRIESETSLQERMRQEALQRPSPDRIEFPTYKAISVGAFEGRHWPGQQCVVEPGYVCYGKLGFEQLNFDRYGWDLGFVAPFVCAGLFFKDVATLPYHMAEDACCCCDCDTGYCLPGDPVPLLLYPPKISLTGAAVEVGTIMLLVAMFP